MLQPLDIMISQLFEAHIWHSYSEWGQKIHELMLAGYLKRVMLKESADGFSKPGNLFCKLR
jgi:hypothetical protein